MSPLVRSLITVLCVACLVGTSFLFLGVKSVLADDYTFSGESVNKGYSSNPSNKNVEDAAYNALTEGDQYTDTNYSASSENVVYGTEAGSFPSDLNTDDATRYSYTEENTGGSPPASYFVYLYPDGDDAVAWPTVYPSGDHYAQVDETIEGGDDGTTYLETDTASINDDFTLADLGDPGAGYTLDIQPFIVHYKGASQPCNVYIHLYCTATYYPAGSFSPTNGAYTNESGTVFIQNPYTSSEWTYSEIDSMKIRIYSTDASPSVRVTQVGLKVLVNFSAATNYELDAQITYSSVTASAQATGFTVLCQGYRTDASEDFYVQVWNYTSTDWVTKDTIDQASDTDFNFNLLGWAANCERSSGDEVKIRILGATETSDSTQNIVYLDVLKVMEIKEGYEVDVDVTCTTAPEHGNISLRVKGYKTASETSFRVDVWNYTSAGYDTGKMTITDTSNTWQTDVDLCDDHHRSGQTVKVRFVDTDAASGDKTQDTLYLDVVWISREYTDPTITAYKTGNVEIEYGQSVVVWATYSDYDNQAPTYVRAHWNASYGAMNANDSDTDYYDGKLYGYTISGLAVGWYYYYFAVKDAESGEITTETTSYTITVTAPSNNAPYFTSSPTTPWANNTAYYYDANAEDDDEDPLTFDLEGNITTWASITPSTGVVQGTPTAIGDYWLNCSVTDGIDTVWDNTSIHIYTTTPSFTNAAITTWLNGTEYTCTRTVTDPETEAVVFDLEGNGTSWASITPSGYSCEVSGDLTVMGWWYLNLSVTDGVHTAWSNWSVNATNDSPYFTGTPILSGVVNQSYECLMTADDNNSDTLIYDISTSPSGTTDWLECNETTGRINGTPDEIGEYWVNMSVTEVGGLGNTTWLNFTITVEQSADSIELLTFILAIIFCFGMLFAGFKYHPLLIGAAPVWIICGAIIFIDYHPVFMYASVMVGLAALFAGVLDVWNK